MKAYTFPSASTCRAYGVVIYELMTLAQLPYVGLSNEEVVRLLIRGGHMETPIPELPFPNDV